METENQASEDAVLATAIAHSANESEAESQATATEEISTTQEPKPSYVKLAMRNMVRKRGKSLQHFFLTTAALIGLFVGLSYLTR